MRDGRCIVDARSWRWFVCQVVCSLRRLSRYKIEPEKERNIELKRVTTALELGEIETRTETVERYVWSATRDDYSPLPAKP